MSADVKLVQLPVIIRQMDDAQQTTTGNESVSTGYYPSLNGLKQTIHLICQRAAIQNAIYAILQRTDLVQRCNYMQLPNGEVSRYALQTASFIERSDHLLIQ
jgi:hypothetical protein